MKLTTVSHTAHSAPFLLLPTATSNTRRQYCFLSSPCSFFLSFRLKLRRDKEKHSINFSSAPRHLSVRQNFSIDRHWESNFTSSWELSVALIQMTVPSFRLKKKHLLTTCRTSYKNSEQILPFYSDYAEFYSESFALQTKKKQKLCHNYQSTYLGKRPK